ncbi:MAG: hypothetical protein K2O45_05380 [Oscillospiraceae bacterium]|nr:hypothetical protein [Oscillospiraceae bacterium]
MKRILTCILTVLILLTLAAPARADILWEPDNNFYEKHRGECTYIGRSYYANGPEGFVTLYNAPNGSIIEAQYQNGYALPVYYQYKDWACITVFGDEGEINGWTKLSDLSLIYDHISFEEEYADRITEYNGEFADYAGDAEEVNFYEYPGAPRVSQSFNIAEFSKHMGNILKNLTGTADSPSYISSIFVDENGLTWGYVNYMYGRLNSWFCLDKPDGTGFPVREVSAEDLTPAQTPVLPARSYLPYILTAAVVIVTIGVLFYFYGRKRKSTD